jgi:phosphatidylserine/phosphatidylglycerophosphate/cardiolipin synthase-like enzyme
MGVDEAKLQPADPPEMLIKRDAWVQLNKLNTIVIPHDPQDDNALQWACKENCPADQAVPMQSSGNEAVYLIDGKEALPQFQCEIEKTAGPGDFIYLLGWFCDIDMPFPRTGRTLRQMWTEKAKAGVTIRVMLCAQQHEGNGIIMRDANEKAVEFVNSLSPWEERGQADSIAGGILDEHFAVLGSHHQKILIVKAGDQLTGFCGGVDVNPDRITPCTDGAPIHDVHCRIRGPAALGLLRIFYDRWNDYVTQMHPSPLVEGMSSQYGGTPAAGGLLSEHGVTTRPAGTFQVQVCRTFGRIRTKPYAFAKKGDQSIRKMIENAIQQAQRFIYIEDQYLIDQDIAKLIATQLPKLRHVTILIPPPNFNTYFSIARGKFLDILYKAGGGKVNVYYPSSAIDGCGTYVHAKTWVFDDKFAAIGSANCNYRGLTHDSEVSAGIYASKDSTLTYTFAHRLRIKLWAHHLNMDNERGWAELADGVASVDAWKPGSGAQNLRVARFDDNPGWFQRKKYWLEDLALDPQGDM